MAQDSRSSLPAGHPDTASSTFLGFNRHLEAAVSSNRSHATSRATVTEGAQRTASLPPKLGLFSRTKCAVTRKCTRCSLDAARQVASAPAVELPGSDAARLQHLDQQSRPSKAASSGKGTVRAVSVRAVSITAVSGLQLDRQELVHSQTAHHDAAQQDTNCHEGGCSCIENMADLQHGAPQNGGASATDAVRLHVMDMS